MFERRRVNGGDIWCVLIDSVQSQANRLEEALLAAAEEDDLPLPYVTVDFSDTGLEPLERITSLDAPHRVYAAILRDSLLIDCPFMKSEEGQRLAAAKPAHATALLELERDKAGRVLIAALGLVALAEQDTSEHTSIWTGS